MNNLIRNLVLAVLLIAVIAGAFYVSFKVSEKMLTPVKKLPTHYLITSEAVPVPPKAVSVEAKMVKPKVVPAKRVKGATIKCPYVVQLGAFAKRSNAQGLFDDLKEQGFEVHLSRVGRLNMVYCGGFNTKEEAEAYRKKLVAAGYQEAIIRRDY